MQQKLSKEHSESLGRIKILAILVQILSVTMIVAIFLVVIILIKEFLLVKSVPKEAVIFPSQIEVPADFETISSHLFRNTFHLILSKKDNPKQLLIIKFEDGVEKSRSSVTLLTSE